MFKSDQRHPLMVLPLLVSISLIPPGRSFAQNPTAAPDDKTVIDTSKPETARDPQDNSPETAHDDSDDSNKPETARDPQTNVPETARDDPSTGPETARDQQTNVPETADDDQSMTPETATDPPSADDVKEAEESSKSR